jgi:hypothetical protein
MLALALQAVDVGSLIRACMMINGMSGRLVPYVRTLPADGFINFARSLVASSIHRPFLAYAHEWYVFIRSIDTR